MRTLIPPVAVQNHKQLDEQSLSSLTAKPVTNAPNPVAPPSLAKHNHNSPKLRYSPPFPPKHNNNPPPWVALLLAASGPCCRRSPACPPRVEAHHRPATRDPRTPGLHRPPTSCSSNPVTAATADRADGTPNNLLLILSILLLLVSSHRASQLPTNRPNNQQDPSKRTNQHKTGHKQERRSKACLPCLPA